MTTDCPVYAEAVRQIVSGESIFIDLPVDESTSFPWLCDPDMRGLKLFGSAAEAREYRSRTIALARRHHEAAEVQP